MKRWVVTFVGSFCLLFATTPADSTEVHVIGIAESFDGVPISYESHGKGSISLVFVHGWSCDTRYWRKQIPFFSAKYQVVTLDLAGHGHSGFARTQYTTKSFGYDVKAVVDALGSERVILIGHSMGGTVAAEAAQLMPRRVVGLVGVDTLQNVEHPLKRDELAQMIKPFEIDFRSHTKAFVKEMIVANSDAVLVEWIINDIAAAPSQVAISAFKEYMGQYVTGEAAMIFEQIKVPVYCLNTDIWPTNVEANRRHMPSFDVTIMKNLGHFPMLERPDEFNELLNKTIVKIAKAH